MEKLKVKFRRIDETVMMKVVQQDESTRGKLRFEHENFYLRSESCPAIYADSLFLMGRCSSDDENCVQGSMVSTECAKEYIKKAKACIKAYNESLEEKEEVVEKEEGRWTPKKGEKYYTISVSNFNGVCSNDLMFTNDKGDNHRLRTNNVFKTKEECIRAVEIEKKKIKLSKVFTKEEWLDKLICKYHICFSVENNEECIFEVNRYCNECTYFETRERAKEFFDFCGADDYKKYVLGVY